VTEAQEWPGQVAAAPAPVSACAAGIGGSPEERLLRAPGGVASRALAGMGGGLAGGTAATGGRLFRCRCCAPRLERSSPGQKRSGIETLERTHVPGLAGALTPAKSAF